jgi:hypothetical protein
MERVSPENLGDFVALFRLVHPGSVHDLNYFQQKFNTSFTGLSYVGFIAYETVSGEPAAFYGVFPCFLMLDNRRVLAAQSGDTMTHPSHQRKGLFLALATATFELTRQLGIRIVFGFPNTNSYPGFINKLNWVHTHDLYRFTVPVLGLPLRKILNYFKLIPKQQRKQANTEMLSTLQQPNGMVRDLEFFRYKGCEPNSMVRFGGLVIWYRADAELWIGDVGNPKGLSGDQVLSSLKAFARRKGYTMFRVDFSHNHPMFGVLNGLGIYNSIILPIGFLRSDVAEDVLAKICFSSADYDTF